MGPALQRDDGHKYGVLVERGRALIEMARDVTVDLPAAPAWENFL